ncbi:hypothetical protein MmTuc01_2812 [Methanosarcina mazei Tuc01]|uniref:Uncharacterized protein n=1 Tax=Methanosarcina mazei Tuc01 TaxID=1236903 RepID=M1QM38_METMZ|nr:hypothetical protein MmTuc01_2812 [Methanosarcina mazei Tuc01]
MPWIQGSRTGERGTIKISKQRLHTVLDQVRYPAVYACFI